MILFLQLEAKTANINESLGFVRRMCDTKASVDWRHVQGTN